MKFPASTAIISVVLLATAPVACRSGVAYAQSDKTPKEQPKPQSPAGGQAAPQSPPPSRPEPPTASRPAPPPRSTGEPELKRRKP